MGDDFDQGDACYEITESNANQGFRLVDIGNGQFSFIISNGISTLSTTADVSANTDKSVITLSYQDFLDEDDDGDLTESVSLTWTKEPNLQVSDFQPVCSGAG